MPGNTGQADVLIVGGGVVGLTAAYELARAGWQVALFDRGIPGREASWAGAGMIPPAADAGAAPLLQELAARSAERWPGLSAELQELTGIDNEYRRCGSVWVRPPGTSSAGFFLNPGTIWHGLTGSALDQHALQELIPGLSPEIERGLFFPEAAQVRNPRHLQALQAACRSLGVRFNAEEEVIEVNVQQNRVTGLRTDRGTYHCAIVLVTAGAWSGRIPGLEPAALPIEPVRGQMLLLKFPQRPFVPLLEAGPRYLVPRLDGHLLVGSTEERVGFERGNTPAGIKSLREFACSLLPSLREQPLVRSWSGLRPCSVDGLPQIGHIPALPGLVVATGHFRAGLSLSPATALMIRNLLSGESTARATVNAQG